MLSLLFASRCKDNPDSNIAACFDSIIATSSQEELEQIEVLIKYDDDDDLRPSDDYFYSLPFLIKTVTYNRGAGRAYLQHFYEYLFTLKEPSSRFVMCMTDDYLFTRPHWISDVLSFKKDYVSVGSGSCSREPGPWHSKPRPPIETINYNNINSWKCIFGNATQCFSVRLIEVCQNYGWQASTDAWAHLLAMMCYQDYGVQIFEYIDAFTDRTEKNGAYIGQKHDKIFLDGFDHSYNLMQQTGIKNCQNLYWFDLVRQQAKNIYLNIKEDGLLEQYQA